MKNVKIFRVVFLQLLWLSYGELALESAERSIDSTYRVKSIYAGFYAIEKSCVEIDYNSRSPQMSTTKAATNPPCIPTTTKAATCQSSTPTSTKAATCPPSTPTTTKAATCPPSTPTTTKAATSPQSTATTTKAATCPQSTPTTTKAATSPQSTATTTKAATSPTCHPTTSIIPCQIVIPDILPGGKCPCNFTYLSDGYCYYFSNGTTSWDKSLAQCEGLNATLACPDTPYRNLVLRTYLKDVLRLNASSTAFWFGGYFDNSTTTWRWQCNNNKIECFDWCPKEPNNYGAAEWCLSYNPQNNCDVHWNDRSCSWWGFRAICQAIAKYT